MSSPIHHDTDLDPALRYAPRWVRDHGGPPVDRVFAPLAPRRRPEFSGDRAMLELQRQLIRNPDAIPEPAADDARALRPIVLRLSAVIALAALIAGGIVSLPRIKKAAEILPDMPATAVSVVPANTVKVVEVHTPPVAPQSGESIVAMNNPAPAAPPVASPVLQSASAPAAAPVPSPQPEVPPDAAPPPSKAAGGIGLDSAEIAAMIKRGRDFLMTGDLASARLLLRRAAEAGSAEAALALGATFDPLVIRRLGAVGTAPDVAQARKWYQRAADLGSSAATGQLAKLAQAQ